MKNGYIQMIFPKYKLQFLGQCYVSVVSLKNYLKIE